MPLITIFTAPKPFTHPHDTLIQRNVIKNIVALGPEVELVLVGYEPGIAETAAEFGVKCYTNVRTTPQGTPLVSSIFDLARQANDSPLLAIINADDLLFPDFIEAGRKTLEQHKKFLICGQRWDIDITEPLEFEKGWEETLRNHIRTKGQLHGIVGSDYFMFPRECYKDMPDFAIGRSGWDNWMIYKARYEKWPTVDVTPSVTVGHENHDYHHLPWNKPPYRLPETQENIRLAGGKRCLFTLLDVDYTLKDGKVVPAPMDKAMRKRRVETFPLITLRSRPLGFLFFLLFNPKKGLEEIKAYILRIIRKPAKA